MNLKQYTDSILRAAIWRFVWTLPPWVIWTIVGAGFIVAVIESVR